MRLWQMPVGQFLTGAMSLLPLGPLAKVERSELPKIGREIGRRLQSDHDFAKNDRIVTMISVLMRLRYDHMTTQTLIDSIPDNEEYPGFKMFLDRGRVEGRVEGQAEGRSHEARALLLRLGSKKFGPATAEQEARLDAIADVERLELLGEKLLDGTNC